MEPVSISLQSFEQFGVLGLVVATCLGFVWQVWTKMQKKIDDNDASAKEREARMAARIDVLENKIVNELTELVKETRDALFANADAMNKHAEGMNKLSRIIESHEIRGKT